MVKKRRDIDVTDTLVGSDDDGMIGVRMDRDLYQAVNAYSEKTDAESVSAAVRELLAIGLTETGFMEDGAIKTLKENARRSAIRRMATCIQAAIVTFKEQDLEFDEEVGEE